MIFGDFVDKEIVTGLEKETQQLLLRLDLVKSYAQCFKITQKVSFHIASAASYIYILSGQKYEKNGENGPFGGVFNQVSLKKDKNW